MGQLFYSSTESLSLIKTPFNLPCTPSRVYYFAGTSRETIQQSTVTKYYVKRLFLGFVDKLLAAFLKFPEVGNLTEANDGNKKFGFLKCVGKGAIDGTRTN